MIFHKEIKNVENYLCVDIYVCCIQVVAYLLCDEVLPHIVLRVEVVRSLKWFEFIKDFINGKITLSGLRGKGLTRPS
jgi:hypothetical protein